MVVLLNFSIIKNFAFTWLRLQSHLDPQIRVKSMPGGWKLTKLTIGKVHYDICFINFVWKWLTTVPKVHIAQVLQDPDFRYKDVLYPLLNHGCYITFVLQMFCQVACLRLQNHPDPILGPSDPILGPPDPRLRVRSKARRLWPDQVNYCAHKLLFYKLSLKMIDNGSISTSLGHRSKLQIQKCDPSPIKWRCSLTLVL